MLIRPYYVGVCCSVAVTFAPDRESDCWECIALNCTQRGDSVVLNAERLTRLNNHHHQSTMASNTTAPKLKYVETSEVRELVTVVVVVVVVVAMSIMRALWNPNMMQLYIYTWYVRTYGIRWWSIHSTWDCRLFFKMVINKNTFCSQRIHLHTYISTYHSMYNIIHALCIPVHAVPQIQDGQNVFFDSMTKNGTTLLNSLIGMIYTTTGSVCQILTTLLFR